MGIGYDHDQYLVNVILQRQVRHQARQPLAVLHNKFLLSSVCCEYHWTVVMCFNIDCRFTFGFVLMQTTEQAALSTITVDCYLLSFPPVCWLWENVLDDSLSSHQTIQVLQTHAINHTSQPTLRGQKVGVVSHDVSCSLKLCSFKTNHKPNQIGGFLDK